MIGIADYFYRGLLLRVRIVTAVGLGLIWSTQASWGSERVAHVGDYTIQNWQIEQGLPQISVTSLAQTPDGYLWVGTFNGLARFDGERFTVFHEGNTPTLAGSRILQLQVDEEGALWIVTDPGRLVRMAAGQFTVVLKQDALLLLGEGEFSNDPNRRLLVADRTTQPWRWWQIENGRLVELGSTDRSRANGEPRFVFENSGVTWLLQLGNLICGSIGRPLSLFANEGTNTKRIELAISSAAASQSGGSWLATETGMYRLRPGNRATWVAPLPLKTKQVSLKEDGQGNLWAGKWGEGVYRLNPDRSWQRFDAETGLADNQVTCLFRDREGGLWVGTGQGGLHRIAPRVFQVYATASGPNVIMSVTQDRQGRMWFGVNGGGLHTWAGGRLSPVIEPSAFRSYALAYSVLADRQDALWVGLYGLRALRWRADAVTPYDLDDGSGQPNTPEALFEDRAGTVWLGCARGLLRYEAGQLARYTTREGMSCNTVTALAEDRSGTLFVGTDGGGLNCLRQGRFTYLTERDGLADSHLTSLYVDREDALWIGTVHAGLSRFKHGRFTTAGVKDGLPAGTIGKMIEDDLGNLWLGSNRGIIRVSRQALNEYLDGKRNSVPWQVFGLSDGLSTLGCAGASQPACWKARDGKLWFATIKGVAVVNPNQLPFNPLPPPVVVEEVVMDEKSVVSGQWYEVGSGKSEVRDQQPEITGQAPPAAPTDHEPQNTKRDSPAVQSQIAKRESQFLTVPPRTHRVEFRFTGLSLAAPEKVQFRYRLDPFDDDWVQAGTRRIAYYTAIPPGRYQFKVTACNNDGVWNEAGTTLDVVVLPPWWMTWWFRALTVLGAAGLVFGGYELRLQRLRRERRAQESFSRQLIASQESERQRLAGELHDGLGQDLLVIASQAQLSLGDPVNPPATAARLKDIADTARQAVQQARRMAHNLRPGLLEELGFTKAVRASAEKAAQASGISLSVSLEDVDGLLPAEFEVNLFRITQESLNNILKHASASEARVTLTQSSNRLRLVVEDDGCGFAHGRLASVPPEQRGFGLRQIAERAKMMGGRVDLRSQPGQGTRLIVEVPLQGSRFQPQHNDT